MRKILVCVLSLMLVVGVTSCGADKESGKEQKNDQKTEEGAKKDEKEKAGKGEIEPDAIMYKEDVEAVVGNQITGEKTRTEYPYTKVLTYFFNNNDMEYIQMFLHQQAAYDKNEPGETVKSKFEKKKESANPGVDVEQIGEGAFYYDGVQVLYKDYWFHIRIGVGKPDDLVERARVGIEIGKKVIDRIDKL